MSLIRRCSRVAVLLFSLTLLASAAMAGERVTPRGSALAVHRAMEEIGFFARVGHFLTSIFAANGASLDPFGGH